MRLENSCRYRWLVVTAMLGVVAITLTGCPSTEPLSTINVSVASGNGRVEQSVAGSIVTLTAIPDEGWEFSGWSGADVDDVNPLTVNTNEVSSISANFIETQQDPPPTAPVDRDNDGVPDEDDLCPNTPTDVPADAQGCPIGDPDADDTDGDGVGDDIDQCEDTAADAEVDANGCSPNQRDGDGDGVTDDLDQCPDTPEGQTDAVNADGCAPSEIDTDGDGVSDDLDNCADTPARTTVGADGCPDDSPGGGGGTGVCGNSVVETGEGCDDGNTVGGDGCDAACQVETNGLTNDSCSAPTTVSDGVTTFSNVGATTDGPDEPAQCNFFDDASVRTDIWYCYTATCTGEAIISLCGSDYDTKMAVYSGCGCPTADPIACSDDDCGTSVGPVDSRVTISVVEGQQYMVRIGGFLGDEGDGRLSISCGVDLCAAATGDCLAEGGLGGPGCGDGACCDTTCEADQYCCDVEWDSFCASEAEGLCDGSFAACETATGTCGSINSTSGCSNTNCCNTVCVADPFCCVTSWDQACVDEANSMCLLTCGGRSGDCFSEHEDPGCNSISCCEIICPEDPFCCSTTWDADCAAAAGELCQ